MLESPRILTLRQFKLLYGMSDPCFHKLVAQGNVRAEKMGLRWRIVDPMWVNKPIRDNMRSEELYILREAEVAEILGIATRNVRRYAASGQLKHRKYGDGRGVRRYALRDIKEFLSNRKKRKRPERKIMPGPREFMVNWAKARLTKGELNANQSKSQGNARHHWEGRDSDGHGSSSIFLDGL